MNVGKRNKRTEEEKLNQWESKWNRFREKKQHEHCASLLRVFLLKHFSIPNRFCHAQRFFEPKIFEEFFSKIYAQLAYIMICTSPFPHQHTIGQTGFSILDMKINNSESNVDRQPRTFTHSWQPVSVLVLGKVIMLIFNCTTSSCISSHTHSPMILIDISDTHLRNREKIEY